MSGGSTKTIPGHPGYGVTTGGDVWSFNYRRTGRTKRLSPPVGKHGYRVVNLCTDGKQRGEYVHRLVLLAFIGPSARGMQCRHLNGNPLDNRLKNLAWGTKAENGADKVLHGTSASGERSGRSKLNSWQVRVIRRCAEMGGMFQWQIGEVFGVSQSAISVICSRKSWVRV